MSGMFGIRGYLVIGELSARGGEGLHPSVTYCALSGLVEQP